MFGAFFGLVLAHNVGVPYPIALIGAMVLTALLGMAVERVFYRRLTRAGGGYTVAGMGMIICGFGMSVALVNVLYDEDENGSFFQLYSRSWGDELFFEIVQRDDGYEGYGAANAPFRVAAQKRDLA